MIRRAEDAADEGEFDLARRWLAFAAEVRPDQGLETVVDAHAR